MAGEFVGGDQCCSATLLLAPCLSPTVEAVSPPRISSRGEGRVCSLRPPWPDGCLLISLAGVQATPNSGIKMRKLGGGAAGQLSLPSPSFSCACTLLAGLQRLLTCLPECPAETPLSSSDPVSVSGASVGSIDGGDYRAQRSSSSNGSSSSSSSRSGGLVVANAPLKTYMPAGADNCGLWFSSFFIPE